MKNIDTSISRLQRLANHLESGKLFEQPREGLTYSGEEYISQNLFVHVNGQLIVYFSFPFRECVHLWPEWQFTSSIHRVPVLKSLKNPTVVDSAKDFFSLDTATFKTLFSPESQNEDQGFQMIDWNLVEDLPMLRKLIAYNIYCHLGKILSEL